MEKQQSNYLRGVGWFLLSIAICQTNDTLMKYLSINVHPIQTTFLRFFFGALWLLPIMLIQRRRSFHTKRPLLHLGRGAILFAAVTFWCWGLRHASLPMAITLGFSMPLFLLILAHFFLHERISRLRWSVTIVGFLGIAIVWNPFTGNLHGAVSLLLLSAVMFSFMDILNKKYAHRESMLAMLFYTALCTLLFAAIPAYFLWQSMPLSQWIGAMALGAGADLILFCLLKSFRLIEASASAPYRYIELLFGSLTGYVFFQEIPSFSTLFGAAVIIPTTLFLACYESQWRQNKKIAKLCC